MWEGVQDIALVRSFNGLPTITLGIYARAYSILLEVIEKAAASVVAAVGATQPISLCLASKVSVIFNYCRHSTAN